MNEIQQEVLRAELERLAANGLDWPDATAQCVLAYFKLSVAYDLAYDPNFCNVRNPTNVWALIQVIICLLFSISHSTFIWLACVFFEKACSYSIKLLRALLS